jgi:hypothetical protein
MAHYLVRAIPDHERLSELRRRLDTGEIQRMRPFGRSLHNSLDNARLTPDKWAAWEEEDYCHPPLAMEREAVLDDYFSSLSVEPVDEGAGWGQIEELPQLWERSG